MNRSAGKAFPRPLRMFIAAFAMLAILPALYASRYFLAAGDYDHSLSAEADAANREIHYLRFLIATPAACAVITFIWAWIHVHIQAHRLADKSNLGARN